VVKATSDRRGEVEEQEWPLLIGRLPAEESHLSRNSKSWNPSPTTATVTHSPPGA
jgi:hypothetical protein